MKSVARTPGKGAMSYFFPIQFAILAAALSAVPQARCATPLIVVAKDKKSFVLEPDGKEFAPWGFNYDHDAKGRLLEDYWEAEWAKVERDFRTMKKLGANVVRIHLQVGKFMESADRANEKALARLAKLLSLAEAEGLYLDLTGLGCYHKKDVPAWYDGLAEKERWDVQAHFWAAVAERCANSPAVFCYDLMNEPAMPGGRVQTGDWLGPPLGDSTFVQFISLDLAGRNRAAVASQWAGQLAGAIRAHDKRHLVTVGFLARGYLPDEVVSSLDFVSVHLYPETGKVDVTLKALAGFASLGKPVVIEETFPLKCSMAEFSKFIQDSKKHARGWIGFYWGQPPEELRLSNRIGDLMTLGWLEFFQAKGKSAQAKPMN
jgi:hypothetical protein